MKPARFDVAWQRRQRLARWWRTARWFVLLGAILAGAALLRLLPGGGEWEVVSARVTICADQRADACVLDGDTLMLGPRRIRLTGYDAPEIRGECEAERLLARRATIALADWLSEAPFAMDGGADPPRDKYGRELRAVRRGDGLSREWLDEHMTDAGLARRSGWGAGTADWCA